MIHGEVKTTFEKSLTDEKQLANSPWVMPLQALHYHRKTLKEVIVIASADTEGKPDSGTHVELKNFIAFVEKVWPQGNHSAGNEKL